MKETHGVEEIKRKKKKKEIVLKVDESARVILIVYHFNQTIENNAYFVSRVYTNLCSML